MEEKHVICPNIWIIYLYLFILDIILIQYIYVAD